ncbi:MAG: hypothetical protein ABI596_17920 [Pyrinomonadaceae bacterium]
MFAVTGGLVSDLADPLRWQDKLSSSGSEIARAMIRGLTIFTFLMMLEIEAHVARLLSVGRWVRGPFSFHISFVIRGFNLEVQGLLIFKKY